MRVRAHCTHDIVVRSARRASDKHIAVKRVERVQAQRAPCVVHGEMHVHIVQEERVARVACTQVPELVESANR